MKLQNYELTETGGALILKTKYSIAPMLKGLSFVVAALAALLVALINNSGFFWILAICVAYSVIALVVVFTQYRRLALRKYPIFTIDTNCVREIWEDEMKNPCSKEIHWADLKCYSEFLVERGGYRNIEFKDVVLFSLQKEPEYAERLEKIKNTVRKENCICEFQKDPDSIYIVLESSDGEKLYSAISDFCERHGIPDPKKYAIK